MTAGDAGTPDWVWQLAQLWPRRRCWSSDHLAGFHRDSWPLAVVHPLLACPNREASGVVCQLTRLQPCAIVPSLTPHGRSDSSRT